MSIIKGLKDINAILDKPKFEGGGQKVRWVKLCLLYTSDAADE